MQRLRIISTSLAVLLFSLGISSAQGANELIPYRNQSLKHNCEDRYLGKGVITKYGEVLNCVVKQTGERGWILSPSKFIPGSSKKCTKQLVKKKIEGVEYTCLKFAEGMRFVKSSTVKNSQIEPAMNSATPSKNSATAEPSSSPTQGSKAGSGTGGGSGNGTGGGGGKGPSPSAKTP
ncbi:MAG: hypothetical protein F2690_01535 [Actinobacteria bacterium]|uniref:Unannotated protein n=1 Tax=freshwater metagenome TaxID=449393 RepID=A0A6J5YQB0_9ZZZZ|nr:hypothetical protein [Actinomycetota bacterium]MSX45471.1 hypothetical protein [Actinomycetota bacterium]MSX71483.1 hypothetical protein [Actinomycetota bacterium]MSY69237.1 hypothetical protein [Actinomycetota bacterium]MTA75440.1 hypothetical protein [Actinomycetota bacterium]